VENMPEGTGHSEQGVEPLDQLIENGFGGGRGSLNVGGRAVMGDVDVNSLLESLSFPWSLHSDNFLSDDDFASLLLGPIYPPPDAG